MKESNFIFTKIEVFDNKLKELTGEEYLSPVNMCFNLNDITAIRETIEDGDTDVSKNRCVIYLKSGESFIIDTPYETLLNYHIVDTNEMTSSQTEISDEEIENEAEKITNIGNRREYWKQGIKWYREQLKSRQ